MGWLAADGDRGTVVIRFLAPRSPLPVKRESRKYDISENSDNLPSIYRNAF
jgi:hypothetical protein